MVLSAKAKENLLIVLDDFKIDKIKTKIVVKMINNLPCKDKTCLIALPRVENDIILSTRNIPKTETIEARNLNVLDLLSFKYLLMPKDSIKVIQETFLKKD